MRWLLLLVLVLTAGCTHRRIEPGCENPDAASCRNEKGRVLQKLQRGVLLVVVDTTVSK